MKYHTKTIKTAFINRFPTMANPFLGLLALGIFLNTVSCTHNVQPNEVLNVDPALELAVFAKPEAAAQVFVQAVSANDVAQLSKILGTDYQAALPLDDIKNEDVDNFISAWNRSNTLLPQDDQSLLIAVGEDQWTLPIPIIQGQSGWHFDMIKGLENMRIRRIGRNELSTMQAVLAYYDAQLEYAEQDRNADGLLEYAQKFISTPGTHDGLYWEVEPGEPLSPLGALLADRTPDGGYHGYYYKVLHAQGEHAEGGAYSYMIGKQMRSGFAIVAWPVEYGETGIMSFLVSHAGVVYERDLGPEGSKIAENMTIYDPGPGWLPAQEVNTPPTSVTK